MVRNPPKKPEPLMLPATIPASCPVVEVAPPKSEPPKFCEQRKGLCYAAIGFVSVSVASSVYVGYRYSIPHADGHFVGKR
jgi:hypothetical protein